MKHFFKLLLLLTFFIALSVHSQAQVTYTSKKSGEFNNPTTWGEKIVPGSNDYNNGVGASIVKFVIKAGHTVTLNIDFELGKQGNTSAIKRELVIEAGATLTGSHKLTLYNNGSKLINNGTLKMGNLVLGRDLTDSAYFTNNGTAEVAMNEQIKNTYLKNNGNLTINSSNAAVVKSTLECTSTGSITFAQRLHLNEGSLFLNKGSILMQATSSDALNVNNGKLYNYGSIDLKGRLNFASAPGNNNLNSLYNYGTFKAYEIYMDNKSSIENWGKLYSTYDFKSTNALIINYPCAYIEQSTSGYLFYNWNTNAKLMNNGFINIKGNFSNDGEVSGSGLFHIYGNSANNNQATIKGDLIIHDFTKASSARILDNYESNKIASSVKTGTGQETSYCPETCTKPVVSFTGVSSFYNLSDEPAIFEIGSAQSNTTYEYEVGDGFAYEAFKQGGKLFLRVWSFLEPDQLGQYTFKVWASNTCGVSATQKQVSILDKDAQPLPVELTRFEGGFTKNAVKLTWSTASEKDNDYFEVERSVNGSEFVKIGQVKGNGNSQIMQNYTFTDAQPMAGTAYYRLKQIDYNGAFEYSKVISVQVKMLPESKNLTLASVYPNPFTSEEVLTAEVVLAQAQEFTLSLMDLTGKTLQSKTVQGQAGLQQITFTPLKNVPAGIYFLRVYHGNQMVVHKLVKNR